MQDILALTIAVAAAAWLARTLVRRLMLPSCAPPPGGPAGADGFVPLERLTGRPDGINTDGINTCRSRRRGRRRPWSWRPSASRR